MATETVTLTIRGQSHSHDIDSEAIDVMLTAFRTLQPPPDVPKVEGDEGYDPENETMKPNPISDTEHFAKRLRLYAEQVTLQFAKTEDKKITPNEDAIASFITKE